MTRNALLIVAVACLASCSTTTSQLTSRIDNLQTWETSAPLSVVFKKYKNDLESDEGGFIGGGIKLDGIYYGDSAELALKMAGLQTIKCLQIVMEKTPSGTSVKAWHYSDHWKAVAARLKLMI